LFRRSRRAIASAQFLTPVIRMNRLRELVRSDPPKRSILPDWIARYLSVGIVTADPDVARRQRITNVAAFATAANAASHGVINSFYDFHGLAIVNVYNVTMTLLALSLPQLHRFGPNVTAIALVSAIIIGQVFVVFALGLASDLHIYYTLAGAMLLFFGIDSWRLFLGFFLLTVAVLLFVLNYAPIDGFVLPQDGMLRDLLSSHAMINTITINAVIIFYALFALRAAERELQDQYARSEALVTAIMPAPIAARLKAGNETRIADRVECLSVMFADLTGFTEAARDRDPGEVVGLLDGVVRDFEDLCERYGVEKIKTVGDGLIAVAGLEGDATQGAISIGKLALKLNENTARGLKLGNSTLHFRIGLHCGPAMAGVIGGTRFSYDVWGDAVNIAARMEMFGEGRRIHVSQTFRDLTAGAFAFDERGPVEIKGIGEIRTYFLVSERK
jgi:adenylate cyclase